LKNIYPPEPVKMASRATRLLMPPTRFTSARKSRVIFRRGKGTSAVPKLAALSWSPARAGFLALATGGAGFAAGIAYNKSSGQDINYSRTSKFPAPNYGSIKDMQAVRVKEDVWKFVR
jgi:D-lactate dehydrogenase (cytochrome)